MGVRQYRPTFFCRYTQKNTSINTSFPKVIYGHDAGRLLEVGPASPAFAEFLTWIPSRSLVAPVSESIVATATQQTATTPAAHQPTKPPHAARHPSSLVPVPHHPPPRAHHEVLHFVQRRGL